MKKVIIYFVLLIGFKDSILCQDSLSTDYPFLYKVKANCWTSYDVNKQMYYYNYALLNDASNRGSISDFLIDISLQNNSILYDTIGLRYDSDYEEKSFRRNYPPRQGRVVAIGFPLLPRFWSATLANRPVAWLGVNKNFPLPGQTRDSLILMSKALPGIRTFETQPYFNIYEFFPNIEDTTATMSIAQMDSIREVVNYRGWTVGPTAPPIDFVPTTWCDTLTSYTTQSRSLDWITTQAIANKYLNYFGTAKTQLQSNNTSGARTTLQQVITDVNIDSSSTPATQTAGKLTSEAYALLRFNTEYLISKLPAQTTPYLNIALKNSTGTKLSGGTLQYYDASWKDAVNNNDGTFNINTVKTSLSLRMTYAYGSQQKNNVPVNSDTVIFQTVNAQVQLRNSSDALLDTGTVQYYAGAWRTFGTTFNGVATKELLANSYSFRMTYGYASNDTVQDLSINPTIVFKTINAQVQLKNSLGDLIDEGTMQYYAGAWRTFGATSNGIATKELLPTNYTFRMSYAYGSSDKAQNIKANPTVLFQTVSARVQVKNAQNNLVNNAVVTYYSGAWRTFGTTVNGQTVKELLPINLQFRAKLGTAQADKTQNLSTNPLVEIQLP